MGSNRYDGLDDYAVRLIRKKARQIVGRAGLVEVDRDDLEQDMVIDLLRRLPRFDPAKAKRETFIARIVEHQVATILESRKAGLRDFRLVLGSLDERRNEDAGGDDGPPVLDDAAHRRETVAAAERDQDRGDLRRDLERVLAGLPPELRDLCHRLCESTVSEISRETGKPRGTVYESIGKLRGRFEDAGLAVYLGRSDTSGGAPVGNR
jgi:RNA polymerase sigma-70 factor (ECF subfamily)